MTSNIDEDNNEDDNIDDNEGEDDRMIGLLAVVFGNECHKERLRILH